MLRNLRERTQSEKGFTLIELLVVILIIGILAAIAIPSFLNQRSKGNDAEAKSVAVTAAEAAETCATDNNGSYTNCTEAALTGDRADAAGRGGPSDRCELEQHLHHHGFSNRDGANTRTSCWRVRQVEPRLVRVPRPGGVDKGGCSAAVGTW